MMDGMYALARAPFAVLLAVLALLAPAVAQNAPNDPLTGDWEGTIDPAQLDLRIEVSFTRSDGGYRGTLAIPLQGAEGLALTDVRLGDEGGVRFAAPGLPGEPTFDGVLDGDGIEGIFRQRGAEVPFELSRARVAPPVSMPAGWTGTWRGVLAPGVADLEMILRIEDEDGAPSGTLAIPGQGLEGLELRFASAVGGGVTIEVPALPADASFGLRLEGGDLVGNYQQETVTFPVTFVRADDGGTAATPARPQVPVPPFPYRSEEVTVDAGDVELAGTLTLPEGDGPFPAVVLLNGSGAQDRNATVAGHPSFLVWADRLTREGLAVLRLDDRGVGGSAGSLAQADHARLAEDALAAVSTLAARDDVDADRIALLGHSEGGIVAPRAAVVEDAPVAAVVLLAAPAVPGWRVLALQNRVLLQAQGSSEASIDAQLRYLDALAAALEAGDADEARRLTRERVEIQLAELPEGRAPTGAARERLVEAQVTAAGSPSFRSFLLAEPQRWLQRLDVPTLAVYGRLDTQVPAVQNEGRMRAALRLAGVADATVRTLPGLNHLLQPASAGGVAEYGRIRTTVAPEALDLVSEWLTERLLD